MSQPNRLPEGGSSIDRSVTYRFSFDGGSYTGHPGDTLASALLANDVHLVGRSVKYRRPRGIHTAGPEEPNAIVTVGEGGRRTTNLKATEVLLRDRLVATSQRGFPGVGRDLGAVTGLISPFLPSGFYYKTFMRPRRAWTIVEPILRRAASSARPAEDPDPDRYDRRYLHCDVLVVGAGPAGLAATRAAAERGQRVVLAEAAPELGGSLLDLDVEIDGQPPRAWVASVVADLEVSESVELLGHTTVFGRYGGGRAGALEACFQKPGRYRYWQIQAARTILACGALERPLLFSGNDRPGVMLAGSVERYLARYGVRPGRRAVVVTNNDPTITTVAALEAANVEVAAIVDTREATSLTGGGPILTAPRSVAVRGRRRVEGVVVDTGGAQRSFDCDLVCVSGGFTPNVHLHASAGGSTVFDPTWGAFVPTGEQHDDAVSVGACAGRFGIAAAIRDGTRAGRGGDGEEVSVAGTEPRTPTPGPSDVSGGRSRVFVDQSTDVDVHGIEVAVREGYDGPQHVKRYTTLGMGPDQGKTANINGAAVVARLRGSTLAHTGTTTYRPPYTPVELGALAARASDVRIAPTRRTPMHDWHVHAGAVFMPSGLWLRPQFYAGNGASAVEAASVEAGNVRTKLGIADVSTLGKVELRGPDVGVLLDLVYTNRFSSLRVGRVRYGVMLRDDGYVFDDGTTARLSDDRWLLTTTSVNAEAVLQHLEYCHQVLRPELDITMASVTDQWAVAAVAGPLSRDVVGAFLGNRDVSAEALPFMAIAEHQFAGTPVRVARISFSGELGFEVAVPADFGLAMWERLLAVGATWGIMPYGLEAMDYLRIEKGHLVVGMDIDGRVSPYDVGLGGMCRTDEDFIGRRSLEMPVFADADRPRLVGLVAESDRMITAGAQLLARPFDATTQESLGRVTSVAFSPVLGRPIALGLLVGGTDRIGERLLASSPVTDDEVAVEVASPHFYDPAGERQRS